MWPGSGLGMELHRERRNVQAPQAFHHSVVERDVADLDATVRSVGHLTDRRVDRETVIMHRDRDLAGRPVLYRLVEAAVPVIEFVRSEAERPAEDLVAETDAEHRHPLIEHTPQRRHRVIGRGRVPGTVGQEHAVRFECEQVVGSRRRRQHVHLATRPGPSGSASCS